MSIPPRPRSPTTDTGLRRFLMNIPETETVAAQHLSAREVSRETLLCLAILVDCVVGLCVTIPPLPPAGWRATKVRRLRAQRALDLAWISGETDGRPITFTQCAMAVHLVRPIDEDVLRARCLALVDTEASNNRSTPRTVHQALYAGDAGRQMAVPR